jgi:hypothetical protein
VAGWAEIMIWLPKGQFPSPVSAFQVSGPTLPTEYGP